MLIRNTRLQRRRFAARAFGSIALVVSLDAQQAIPPQPAGTQSLTLEAALARAVEANPTVSAARLRRNMGLAEMAVARERLNPEARVEIERETPKQAYALAVPLETGGKRGRRIAVSEAAIRTIEAELAVAILDIHTAVRRAYFARVAAESRLVLLGEVQGLATRMRAAAQDRFEAGSAPRLELVQAELALAQVENDAIAAHAAAGVARVQLNALLAFPVDAPSSLSTALDPGAVLSADAAAARARQGNAELVVLERRLVEQRARVALARAMQIPDVTPEATITHDAQPEFNTGWRAAVAVAIPIFTRHQAGVRLEEATLTQLIAERDAAVARVTGEAVAAAALADSQRQLYLRYRDRILPQALEVERMAEDSYRLGQTGIVALLQALQATRDARLRALQAGLDFQNALADLERAIGTPIP